MGLDWKTAYVRKMSPVKFSGEKVNAYMNYLVDELNVALKTAGLDTVTVDGDNYCFPDCIINLEITSQQVTFTKRPKNNYNNILTTVNLVTDDRGYYKLNYDSENYENLDKEIFKDAISYLLLKK